MKKLLSFILVIVFVLSACQICVSAAESDGNVYSEWKAQAGTISKLSDGLFQMNAFDESKEKTDANPKAARQAVWSGSLTEGKFTVVFDAASIFAGRGDKNADGTQKSGANDTAIIFGGKGVKDSKKTTVNNIEKDSSYYALMFSNDNLRIALVDKAWKGNVTTYPEAATINKSVSLKTELGDKWTAAKDSGKIALTVEFTAAGAVKVYVNGNHVKGLDRAEGICVPFGGDLGVRCGMGYHVPTKIYEVKVEKAVQGGGNETPEIPETPETPYVGDWYAKLGSISALEGGVFQIDPFDETKPASVTNVKGQRQAMWTGSLNAGKISITFDWASIVAGRGDKNADGTQKAGANDTAIIFGGNGIAQAQGDTINKIENASCYYAVMFSNENLRIARIQNGWQGTVDKFPAAIKDVSLKTQLGDDWTAAKADGKVKLSVEFTEAGAVKVYVDDLHVAVMDREEGSCVPFGGEVGVRCGNGFHVPTKIYDFSITEAGADIPEDPDDDTQGGTTGDNTGDNNTDNENEKPNTDSGNNATSGEANIGGTDEPTDAKVKIDTTTIIIIAVVAALAIAGAVIGIILAKKKKKA